MARTKKPAVEIHEVEKKPKAKAHVALNQIPPPEISTDKTLDSYQLRQLEVTERDVANGRLAMSLEEQVLQNLNLQKSYLELAIEKQKAKVSAKAQDYETVKKRYETISRDIFAKHGIIGEQVGYDSHTGKIVI